MHYNVQIHIQQVQEAGNINRDLLGRGATQVERKVTSVLELKITAATEIEAYERAIKILSMNSPETVRSIYQTSDRA